jgi:hypothetical protein
MTSKKDFERGKRVRNKARRRCTIIGIFRKDSRNKDE